MAIKIEIKGSVLYTPDATIVDCWEDRSRGLLSRKAGLALMSYMNEQERLEAEYDRIMDGFEEGDPGAPSMPDTLYEYSVDGEVAFAGKEVTREQCAIWYVGDGQPTGRVFMSTLSETMRLLDGV